MAYFEDFGIKVSPLFPAIQEFTITYISIVMTPAELER